MLLDLPLQACARFHGAQRCYTEGLVCGGVTGKAHTEFSMWRAPERPDESGNDTLVSKKRKQPEWRADALSLRYESQSAKKR